MTLIEPHDAKRALRAMLRLRPATDRLQAIQLTAALLKLRLPDGAVVAGVAPMRDEPDLMAVWETLHMRGHRVVLPETTLPGSPLLFRDWQPGAMLQVGRFGTAHPDGPERQPDILFVPLLAWDRRLFRLGYGGGYYDRTLAALPHVVPIGFGFAAQEVASVPTGPYDEPLSAMVTERETITPEGLEFADLVSGRHRRPQRA
ncbi:5-formyltetrahydrofolate cyclo-ligase [Lichenicola sp.]|uniref:5-formyltetrahydrofolate cyclo-ligase n=1 Tax=Lichenicola sp. TaxID=2804529 RepID=UPI003B00E7B0